MTDRNLSAFDAGGDRRDDSEEDEDGPGRADEARITEQCRARTASGDRCQNAVSHMTASPLCGPHSRADDVEVIDE